ncbi:MAG: DUF1552 domain-containing protein [Myxococcales bacterium]|nr:DUF1552 domain-containing protein [Myxococcales bacterium]
MNHSRRFFLRGVGGIALGLPFLEGLSPKHVYAQSIPKSPFAIFLRQANGPASKHFGFGVYKQHNEEKFWPKPSPNIFNNDFNLLEGFSARLTNKDYDSLGDNECTVQGRVFELLDAYLDQLMLISGVEYPIYPGEAGCGHGGNVVQALTGSWRRDPHSRCGTQLPRSESLDYLLQRTFAKEEDHLYLMAGKKNYLGECMSYGTNGIDLTAFVNPLVAYEQVVSAGGGMDGGSSGLNEEVRTRLLRREESINDFLKAQFDSLLRNAALSQDDRRRLLEHQERIRSIELEITNPSYACSDDPQRRALLEAHTPAGLSSPGLVIDGDLVLETARHHIDIAILAVLCGRNRAVTLQIDDGNAGTTRYSRPDGSWMENYHFVSHRVATHSSIITSDDNAMYWDHHEVDKHLARTYKYLLDGLREAGIEDDGIAVWFSEMGHGPFHAGHDIPYIVSGSLGGQLKTGHFVQLPQAYKHKQRYNGDARGVPPNHRLVLNTLGAALGLKEDDQVTPLRTFGDSGDPSNSDKPAGYLPELLGPTPLGADT